MSYIHVSPKAVASARTRAPALETHSQVAPASRESEGHSDSELTQAWSIGVTDSGQSWSESPAPQMHAETCPPEVYIG